MKSMHLLLDEAEDAWRKELKRDFPLCSDTPIIRKASPNGRDWTFSTDLKTIFAQISGDESLQKRFEVDVAKYWDGDPEKLARETLHYLLFHELYHPLEAPFSVIGENNDNKRIHQAIRQGVLQAESNLSALEQMIKVLASQNGVKDFVLDNRFYIDNKKGCYVKDDIIPTWDLLELQDAPSRTNFYTVTRLLYGFMYGPQTTHAYFKDKAGKKGVTIAKQALSALISKNVQLPKGKDDSLVGKVKALFGGTSSSEETSERLQEYVHAIRAVFLGEDRYEGIKRFMAVLGPYVEKNMPQGRSDMQGEGSGASPSDILQDLLDDMTPEEQAQFLQSLAQESTGTLEQAASSMMQKPDGSKPEHPHPSVDEMKNLDLLAAHEFYKRNHPSVRIIGGKMVGESIVVGKREYWDFKRSSVLTENQLGRVNLNRINALQRKTRLPWLIDLGNGTYRLNEYEVKQRDIKDIVYIDASIDVPDVVEFYLDSSGSMFGNTSCIYKFNDGSRWDMLCQALYGFVEALYFGGKQVGKECRVRIHNVAETQIDSELVPVSQFWEGNIDALKVLFKPENGYEKENFDITYYQDNYSRAYVVAADGQIEPCSGVEVRDRAVRMMKKISRTPENNVVLFEIGGTYDLGTAVQGDPNIRYHQVHDKDKMFQAGLEVLLSK